MKHLLFGGLLLVACVSSLPAIAQPAKCLLVAEEKKVLEGPCDFRKDDADGSFTVSAGKVSANVLADPGATTGRAFYEDPTGAWVIGDVNRKGACWSNKHGKLCAWAADAGKAAAPPAPARAAESSAAEPASVDPAGSDIASDKAVENLYGAAHDWQVGFGRIDGSFAYCYAEMLFDEGPMRIGYDGGQWQLGLLVRSKAPYEGSIEVDGRSFYAAGTANQDWTFVWLDMQMLDAVRNGDELVVELNRQSINRPLKGIAAAITKVDECVQRKGVPPGGKAAAEPASEPTPGPVSTPLGQARKLETGFYGAEQAAAGEWRVMRFSSDPDGRKDMYCATLVTKESDLFLRLAYDAANKEFTLGFAASPPADGGGQAGMIVSFDKARTPAFISDEAYFLTDPDGGEYISMTDRDTPKESAAAFASHKTVTIGYRLENGSRTETFDLAGAKAAIAALFRCASGR